MGLFVTLFGRVSVVLLMFPAVVFGSLSVSAHGDHDHLVDGLTSDGGNSKSEQSADGVEPSGGVSESAAPEFSGAESERALVDRQTGHVAADNLPAEVEVGPREVSSEEEVVVPSMDELEVADNTGIDPACEGPVSADLLNQNIGSRNGLYEGGDYQRAFDLGNGRVLWVLQDAFLKSKLVHNAAFLQEGTCFELLNKGTENWLYNAETRPRQRWFWIFDANVIADLGRVELVVAEMVETGPKYLSRVRIAGTSIVTVDTETLEVVSTIPFQENSDFNSDSDAPAFYGWSIVDNADDGYRYLWSHCYAQFGFDGVLGFGSCSNDMYLARIEGPSIAGTLEYWDGSGWSTNPTAAQSTVNFFLSGSGNNPGDIAYEPRTGSWHLIMKPDDWWGSRVIFATAPHPSGPWVVTDEVETTNKCGECSTYYASWIPSSDSQRAAWSLGHNHWHIGHTSYYLPTFHEVS